MHQRPTNHLELMDETDRRFDTVYDQLSKSDTHTDDLVTEIKGRLDALETKTQAMSSTIAILVLVILYMAADLYHWPWRSWLHLGS